MPTIKEIVETLEISNALDLGESPWKPESDEPVDIYEVDWDSMFPVRKPEGDSNSFWELDGDEWVIDQDVVDEILTPVDSELNDSKNIDRKWDVCAWYQPIHFNGYDWGIFIKEECIRNFAQKLYVELTKSLGTITPTTPKSKKQLVKALLRTAFSVYYHHEFFHHKMECFGIRLHSVERRCAYTSYFKSVYIPQKGTNNQLEEALANAHMYREFNCTPWIPKKICEATRKMFDRTFPSEPPGYRKAIDYLKNSEYEPGKRELFSRMQEGLLSPIKNPDEWVLGPRLDHAFFNIKSDIWTVVRPGTKSIIPAFATPIKTCTTSDMVKLCNSKGYNQVPGGKGSHIKLKKPGASTIILPGNRDNLSPGVVKNILNILGDYSIHNLPHLISSASRHQSVN